MFDDILIGVDGRQGGRDAIALALALAAPQAQLTLAHVDVDAAGRPFFRGLPEDLGGERERSMALLAADREAAGIDAELVCRRGISAAHGLHLIAAQRATDLIVVGSSRHALLGRVLIGDDARASLDGAPCAIAIAPRGYTQSVQPMLELGVGYDGSPESELALAAARELAARHGARIRALSVVSLRSVEDEAPIPADWPDATDRLLDAWSARLSELPGVEGEAVYGGPREELTRFSSEVDALVVGGRGYGPPGHVLHGSVARYLVGHAACPLLVLARSAASGAEAPDGAPTREAREQALI
jgi:nucleotide-binding universal stress UspA family protein